MRNHLIHTCHLSDAAGNAVSSGTKKRDFVIWHRFGGVRSVQLSTDAGVRTFQLVVGHWDRPSDIHRFPVALAGASELPVAATDTHCRTPSHASMAQQCQSPSVEAEQLVTCLLAGLVFQQWVSAVPVPATACHSMPLVGSLPLCQVKVCCWC